MSQDSSDLNPNDSGATAAGGPGGPGSAGTGASTAAAAGTGPSALSAGATRAGATGAGATGAGATSLGRPAGSTGRPTATKGATTGSTVAASSADDADDLVVLHPQRPSLLARLGAEALGTFALVLIALGLALYAQLSGATSGLGLALGVAFVVSAGAVALGHVSGGHFNPAVTFGAVVAGRAPVADLVPYWLAQLVGGALAAAALFVTIPSELPGLLQADGRRGMFSTTANGYGERSPLSTLSQTQVTFDLLPALLVELVAAAILVAVVLGATSRRVSRSVAPIAMGLAYGALVLLTAPITNAGLNPARSTAAALFSEGWAFGQLWVFWAAPLVGAAIAGLAHRAFAVDAGHDNLLEEDNLLVDEDSLLDDGVDEITVSPRL